MLHDAGACSMSVAGEPCLDGHRSTHREILPPLRVVGEDEGIHGRHDFAVLPLERTPTARNVDAVERSPVVILQRANIVDGLFQASEKYLQQ